MMRSLWLALWSICIIKADLFDGRRRGIWGSYGHFQLEFPSFHSVTVEGWLQARCMLVKSLGYNPPICLGIAGDWFHATLTELSSYNRDCMAHRKIFTFWTLTGKVCWLLFSTFLKKLQCRQFCVNTCVIIQEQVCLPPSPSLVHLSLLSSIHFIFFLAGEWERSVKKT